MKSPYSPHDPQTPDRPVRESRWHSGSGVNATVTSLSSGWHTLTLHDDYTVTSATYSLGKDADLRGLADMLARAAGGGA